jgi:diacylglycerol O-acyltransferase / wax synthase
MKRLNGWDAMMLYGETPNLPGHTLKIAIIDDPAREFTFDKLRQVVQRRLPVLEPLCYRLIDIPLKTHHPMWLENCDIDLDHHLRRHTLSRPGGRRELDNLVAEIAVPLLDLSRPLWQMHFVEGLQGGRIALVVKLHHALADGVASANLLALAMDSTKRRNGIRPDACRAPARRELLRTAGRDHLHQVKGLPALIADTVAGISRVRRGVRERSRHPDLAKMFSPPSTALNHLVAADRRFATSTVALADAKQTSKHLGITLNDLVLALSAGALRTLLMQLGGASDQPLIAAVPMNTDPRPERISGNALGALLVSLPVHIDDVLERVELIRIATTNAKENNLRLGPELMGRWMDYAPPPLAAAGLRRMATRSARNRLYNVSVSNVRGPRDRGCIGGAVMSQFYSVGPLTAGIAVNITVWSYVDQLNISILTDDSIGDPHQLTDAMSQELVDIRRAAGLPGELTAVENAMEPAVAVSEQSPRGIP